MRSLLEKEPLDATDDDLRRSSLHAFILTGESCRFDFGTKKWIPDPDKPELDE